MTPSILLSFFEVSNAICTSMLLPLCVVFLWWSHWPPRGFQPLVQRVVWQWTFSRGQRLHLLGKGFSHVDRRSEQTDASFQAGRLLSLLCGSVDSDVLF